MLELNITTPRMNTLFTNPESISPYGDGVLFPWKLHEMLSAAEEQGFTTVVSWLPDSKSFKVHDKETFTSLILNRYFEQTKYKSFQRQLNMWGFERLNEFGPAKGGYTHQFFERGNPSLCCRMNRMKRPSGSKRKAKKAMTTGTTANKKAIVVDVDAPQSSSTTSTTATTSLTKSQAEVESEDSSMVESFPAPTSCLTTNIQPTKRPVARISACSVISQDSAASYCEDLNSSSDHTNSTFNTHHHDEQDDAEMMAFIKQQQQESELYPEVNQSPMTCTGGNISTQADVFEGQSFFPLEVGDIDFWLIDF